MSGLTKDAMAALRNAYAREGSYAKVGLLLATADRPSGYTGPTICQLLRSTYPAKDLSKIEAAIRATLLNETVECPVLGTIAASACLDWQSRPFAATNPQRVRVYRACRNGCPNSRRR